MNYDSYSEKEIKKEKRKNIVAIVLIAAMTALAVVFASLYAAAKAQAGAEGRRYRTTMENQYRKSYYGLVYNVDGLDGAVAKLSVARSNPLRQEYLSDMTAYSTAAGENLSNLVEEGSDNSKIMKFINQTGDFAKYLDDKLSKGGEMEKSDRDIVSEIGSAVREIQSSLQKIAPEVEKDGFSFLASLKEEDGAFSEMIRSFENEDIDYPSMIYDGPFSDSMTERTAKALTGKEVSEREAREKLKFILENTEIADISVKAGSKNVFETFDFELITSRGKCFVTLSKKGAFPISVNYTEAQDGTVHIPASEAEKRAEAYLEKIGIKDMKAVWVSLYDNVYYVNLAYFKEGVVYYPDLIKVKVGGEEGEVIGMESLNYVFNHSARVIEDANVSATNAVLSVSEEIAVGNIRLAVVPTKGDGETLAYEIYGTKGEDKYFVYVSAKTGAELKIMRVLDGERGLLLV